MKAQFRYMATFLILMVTFQHLAISHAPITPVLSFVRASTQGENENRSEPGRLYMKEVVWLRLLAEPTQHLLRAHEKFDIKDFASAAREMSVASGFILIAAGRAENTNNELLIGAAHELDLLAASMNDVANPSLADIKEVFALAAYALASNNYNNARLAMQAQDYLPARLYIAAAVDEAEHMTMWSDSHADIGMTAAADSLPFTSEMMFKSGDHLVEDANQSIQWDRLARESIPASEESNFEQQLYFPSN